MVFRLTEIHGLIFALLAHLRSILHAFGLLEFSRAVGSVVSFFNCGFISDADWAVRVDRNEARWFKFALV